MNIVKNYNGKIPLKKATANLTETAINTYHRYILAVELDHSGLYIVEAEEKPYDGTLAPTGGTDDGQGLTRRNDKRHVTKDGLAAKHTSIIIIFIIIFDRFILLS